MEEINNNNVCKLSCGHYYCLDCIIELKKHSNKCPCCRSIVFNNENILKLGKAYPRPIVIHEKARLKALNAFKKI